MLDASGAVLVGGGGEPVPPVASGQVRPSVYAVMDNEP